MGDALTAAVKAAALESGADLVGIGSMDRFEGAPKEFDPRFIFPEAKSIIGLGFRVHRGLFRGIEEGTFFAAYPSLGYANINDLHAPLALRELGSFVEDQGYEAMLYSNTSVRLGTNKGQPVAPGLPAPDVFLHFRIAAFICGMGEIGFSKVFLTPRFGPRQRFAFILTDAPLDPDPLYSGPPLCDRCMTCVRDCPTGAIVADKTVQVTIAGREVEWSDIDTQRCWVGWQAATPEYNPFLTEELAAAMHEVMNSSKSEEEQRKEWGDLGDRLQKELRYIRNTMDSFHHPAAICGGRGCMRGCMAHLESQHKLGNAFQNPFRKRPAWRLGE
jgi:epoxyqueuosine reductase